MGIFELICEIKSTGDRFGSRCPHIRSSFRSIRAAYVSAAPASFAARVVVAVGVCAADSSSSHAYVSATARLCAADEGVAVPVYALNAGPTLTWTQGILCHRELHAIVRAAFASWRSARIAAAGAALAAHEIVAPLVHTADATWGRTHVSAARRVLATEEWLAFLIEALDSVLRACAVLGDRILLAIGFTALALRRRASIAATTVALGASKIVAIRVCAARATCSHADVAATFACSARELDSEPVFADGPSRVAPLCAILQRKKSTLLIGALSLLASCAHGGNK